MTDTTTDKPIVVSNSAVPAQLLTAAQYIVATTAAFVVGKGWISHDTAEQIAAMIPAIIAAGYGIYRTYVNNEQKKTIINDPATTVPTSVAKVI